MPLSVVSLGDAAAWDEWHGFDPDYPVMGDEEDEDEDEEEYEDEDEEEDDGNGEL